MLLLLLQPAVAVVVMVFFSPSSSACRRMYVLGLGFSHILGARESSIHRSSSIASLASTDLAEEGERGRCECVGGSV